MRFVHALIISTVLYLYLEMCSLLNHRKFQLNKTFKEENRESKLNCCDIRKT